MTQETQPIQPAPQIIEQQPTLVQEILTSGDTSSREVVTTVPPDSDEHGKGEKGWNLPPVAKLSYAALINIKTMAQEVIASDPESRRLVLAAFQERLEEGYLKGMEVTDRERVYTLRKQVRHANELLSEQFGEGINLPVLYRSYSQKDPDRYPPLNTAEGLTAYFARFYPEIIGLVLSASEIASERAEIEAQKALTVHRNELERTKLEEAGKTAQKLVEEGDTLKSAEELKGEIRAARHRGFIKATLGVAPDVAETSAEVPIKFFDKIKGWVEYSPEMAIPVFLGGSVAPTGTFLWLVYSSEAQAFFGASPLGVVGEAAVILGSIGPGIFGAIAVTRLGIAIRNKVGEAWSSVKSTTSDWNKRFNVWLEEMGWKNPKKPKKEDTNLSNNERTSTEQS